MSAKRAKRPAAPEATPTVAMEAPAVPRKLDDTLLDTETSWDKLGLDLRLLKVGSGG
jgi:hypothetical protein